MAPLYSAAAASSTASVDVRALLAAPVGHGGTTAPLRSMLQGERTLLLFVRNGA